MTAMKSLLHMQDDKTVMNKDQEAKAHQEAKAQQNAEEQQLGLPSRKKHKP
jgi:hypothetical protein